MCLGPTIWNFLHVTNLAPRILCSLLGFGIFVLPFWLFNTWLSRCGIFEEIKDCQNLSFVLELYRSDQLCKIHNRNDCPFDILSILKVLSAAVHITTRRSTSTATLWIENFDLDACNHIQSKHWHNHEFYWITNICNSQTFIFIATILYFSHCKHKLDILILYFSVLISPWGRRFVLEWCRWFHIRSRVQKFPAWHTKAAPNGKYCEGYNAIYGEVNVSDEKCVEIKGGYVEK